MMKKLITPIVLVLCSMLPLSGHTKNSVAPAASNRDISTKEPITHNKAMVINRLEEVGYSKEEAMTGVDKMSKDEIAYFAQHPESIKRSGFVLIASSIGSSVYSSIKHGQRKKEAEIQRKRDEIASLEREINRKQNEQNRDLTLLQSEHDPEKTQQMKAEVDTLGKEIKALEDSIKSLENDINVMTGPKKATTAPATSPKR
jgi:chromosome segregation ATPase